MRARRARGDGKGRAATGGRSWKAAGRGSPHGESSLLGRLPSAWPRPPSGSGPEAEPHRPEEDGGTRLAPAASPAPPYPARHGAQPQHAPHRRRFASPDRADKMETASSLFFFFFLISSELIYCLGGTSGADAPAPQLRCVTSSQTWAG